MTLKETLKRIKEFESKGKIPYWRQGDVGLLKIDKVGGGIPPSAKPIEHNGILAYGETTGHKHQVVGGRAHYFMDETQPQKLFFKVESRFVDLNHGSQPTVKEKAPGEEGHFPHQLPAGEYVKLPQDEFDWMTETIRPTED